jgi:hypothetical protein
MLGFRQDFQYTKKIKKIVLCIRPSLSKLENHIVFLYNNENFKKNTYILTCILILITNLLKLRELDQYLKKKKLFCFNI